MMIQPWSPFQYGFFEGVFVDNDKFPEVNQKMQQYADKYGVTNTTIAIARLLRQPAKMQPIIGTMNPDRLKEIEKDTNVNLERTEWYDLYRSADNRLH